MNYLTEERKNGLSSEYVLGTLQGSARLRYQGLLMEHRPMRQALWRWEKHLNALGAALPEKTPDPSVWERIQQRLGFIDGDKDTVVPIASGKPAGRGWRWMAAAASVAAIALAVVLVRQPAVVTPEPAQVAVVQGAKAEALWLIELTESHINVQATEQFTPVTDKDYELWLVAADGRAPVSLGLLPEQGRTRLERSQLFDRVDVAALAVSLEPPGGSPTGSPTEVLYTAQLVAM